MVRPILEYASTIWDPHTNLNIDLLESMQRSDARFFYNMLNQFSLPTLQERRKINELTIMFKIINNLIDISACKFIPKQRSLRRG